MSLSLWLTESGVRGVGAELAFARGQPGGLELCFGAVVLGVSSALDLVDEVGGDSLGR